MSPVRLARPDEAAPLRDLVRAAHARWVPAIGWEPALMADDCAARIAAGQAHALDGPDARPQGVLVPEGEPPDGLLIDNVALAPAMQGKGLGRALIAFAEARRRGRARLRLCTSAAMEANIRLHRQLRFVETRRAGEAGFHRVHMEKRLP